jgi:tetratricopeptide (TPR) repeat protein
MANGAPSTRHVPMSAPARPPGTFLDTPLKWVVAVVALVSLLLVLNQASNVFTEIRDRQRQIGELQAAADQQRRAGDFPAAWASLKSALTATDQGSYLATLAGPPRAERLAVQTAQEDLAMAWLQRASVPQDRTFPDLVQPLMPVIARGIATAGGRRKADLLAHAGWAYFLKSKDGTEGSDHTDPESFYRQALDADPTNPYAHAHWGHWKAWTRRPLAEATAQFDAALASGRARPYVRGVQLAALRLMDIPAAEAAFLGAVTDMVKNQEPVDAPVRRDLYGLFSRAFDDDARFARLAAAVPPAAQIAALRALFFDVDLSPSRAPLRDGYLARLQEAAGDAPAALETWRSIVAALPASASGPVADRARAAVAGQGPALLR